MKTTTLLALFICLGGAAPPHDENTPLLHKAARCLAAKDFLPPTKAPALTFGYVLDERSYPGEKLLYVVAYLNASRRKGFVFMVFVSDNKHSPVFNIQNNARFTLNASRQSVDFTEPALGGEWTQQHIISAIRQIERRHVTTIRMRSLLAADRSIRCQAYTDPQPRTESSHRGRG